MLNFMRVQSGRPTSCYTYMNFMSISLCSECSICAAEHLYILRLLISLRYCINRTFSLKLSICYFIVHTLLSVLYQFFCCLPACFTQLLFFCNIFPLCSFVGSLDACAIFSIFLCVAIATTRDEWAERFGERAKNRTCYEFTWELKCIQNNCLYENAYRFINAKAKFISMCAFFSSPTLGYVFFRCAHMYQLNAMLSSAHSIAAC